MLPSSARAVAFVCASLAVASAALAQTRGRVRRPEPVRCGCLDIYAPQPLTDLDPGREDGRILRANASELAVYRVQEGTTPRTYLREHQVHATHATGQRACADLWLGDLDGNGLEEIVYATPSEVAVLEALDATWTQWMVRLDASLGFAFRAPVRIVEADERAVYVSDGIARATVPF